MSFPQLEDIGTANYIEMYVHLVLGKRPQGAEVGWSSVDSATIGGSWRHRSTVSRL